MMQKINLNLEDFYNDSTLDNLFLGEINFD
jgi:hypothetical protein